MLLLAEIIAADEAAACGYVDVLSPPGEIEAALDAMCRRLMTHAPLTMRAAKEAIRRITLEDLPDGDDLIRACYGSADFKEGVEAFLAKRPAKWSGR